MTRPDRVPWAALAAFIVIAFGLAWLVVLPLWLHGGLANPLAGPLLVLMMYTPGIAAVTVLWAFRRTRPARVLEYLGVRPLRPVGRTVLFCLIGIFGTIALVVAGAFLAAALGVAHLDPVHFSGFASVIRQASGGASVVPVGLIVAIQLVMIPFGAIVNAFAAVGEELGWRGWLVPSLRPLGTWAALPLSGAIWGLWHAPIILLGYDFGLADVRGVLLMTGACVIVGTLFGWLRLRSASLWPSVFAHGALNAAGGFAVLVAAAGHPIDPVSSGPLGWATWIVGAIAIAALAASGQFRRQSEPRRAPAAPTGMRG